MYSYDTIFSMHVKELHYESLLSSHHIPNLDFQEKVKYIIHQSVTGCRERWKGEDVTNTRDCSTGVCAFVTQNGEIDFIVKMANI